MDSLSNLNGLPQYIRIRESVRQRIQNGELNRGEKLPPEEELAASFGVSRMTLRQSLSDLIDEGLLYRKHGIGTFVAFQHFARDHSHLRNFFESSKADGIAVDEQVLDSLPRTERNIDVTGSIFAKIRYMIDMASLTDECLVLNGKVPGRLEAAIRGDDVIASKVVS